LLKEKKKLIDIGFSGFFQDKDRGFSNQVLDRLIFAYQSTSVTKVLAAAITA
jgi:hypothetical protein